MPCSCAVGRNTSSAVGWLARVFISALVAAVLSLVPGGPDRDGPAGSYGVGTIDQRVPFQCSASVLSGLVDPCLVLAPTAQHARWDRQNTERSAADLVPAGFGLLTLAHFEPRQCSISVWTLTNPTAKQLSDVAQDTPGRSESVPGGRGAVGVSDHFLPFHRSAIADGKPLFPVAKQSVPGHQTPASPPPVDGVAATDHRRPFQCSASPRKSPLPTAQQLASRRQNTPSRLRSPAPRAVATTDHFLPVQCSARGRDGTPCCRAAEPTAQHRVTPVHQTPNRTSAASPAGSGDRVSDHFLPFQCSAIGFCFAVPSAAAPTAQQFCRAEQDTALRNVTAEPATLGLAFGDHLLPFQCSIKVRVTPDAV
jgi:hypothetical protein